MKGPNNLITMRDLKEIRKPKISRQPMKKKLAKMRDKVLHFHDIAWPAEPQEWYKPVVVPAVTIEKVEESDLTLEGKARLRVMLEKAEVSHFKNDCGSLPAQYTHTIIR